jgi:uncharacterized protein (TIGR02145 family)
VPRRPIADATLLMCAFFVLACNSDIGLTDMDGNRYGTARIGQQTWMTENLRLDVGEGSYCYNDDPARCIEMGRLYTWEAATEAADRIPGWHLPSQEDWLTLIASSGPDSLAYRVMISEEFGFAPQWSGVRVASGQFRAMELKTVNYWSSTVSQQNPTLAWSVAIMSNLEIISPHNYPRVNACSVRLIKDN